MHTPLDRELVVAEFADQLVPVNESMSSQPENLVGDITEAGLKLAAQHDLVERDRVEDVPRSSVHGSFPLMSSSNRRSMSSRAAFRASGSHRLAPVAISFTPWAIPSRSCGGPFFFFPVRSLRTL